MIIIYHCYGGTHSSVVAASIHTNLLPKNYIPSSQQLLEVSLFDSEKKVIPGKLHYFGTDDMNREIYSCGLQNSSELVIRTSTELIKHFGIDYSTIKFVNTLDCVNILMRIGGYLSQRLEMKKIGTPIVIAGTLKAYPKLLELVKDVKNNSI